PAEVTDVEGMARVARHLHGLGARWVLVKGGHLPGVGSSEGSAMPPSVVPDILFDGHDVTVLSGAHVPTANVHGSGCSLSAAIAARLATGCDVPTAVADAKAFVTEALRGGAEWQLGKGHGPLDHLGWSTRK
ncbi:MAG TPA: bifunctional hydroxymethylpyrimidine kinase/phosphomethylpyrimidine kinase, partial [Acidimicrobiales bacterium]|nr:bifunctional hydroxymethylpyrimidine kinase/phosphomethylpyrimidine kinase [Acidimicrobiales bacterium]